MNGQTKFVIEKLKQHNAKKVLNIGFRYNSDLTIRDFVKSSGGEFHALEIWEANCKDMTDRKTVDRVIHGDAQKIAELVEENEYDAIIWLHGPEHIYWDEFLACRDDIERCASKLIIYQAPIGEDEQGALYENPYEEHVQELEPNMFGDIGYTITLHNGGRSHDYDQCIGERTFSAYVEKV